MQDIDSLTDMAQLVAEIDIEQVGGGFGGFGRPTNTAKKMQEGMGYGTMGHRLGFGAIPHVGHGMPDTNIHAGGNILTHISSAGNGSSSLGHCNTPRNTETHTSAHYGDMVHQVGYLPLCDRQHLAHAEQLLRHQQQTWTLSNLDLCQNQQDWNLSTSDRFTSDPAAQSSTTAPATTATRTATAAPTATGSAPSKPGAVTCT